MVLLDVACGPEMFAQTLLELLDEAAQALAASINYKRRDFLIQRIALRE